MAGAPVRGHDYPSSRLLSELEPCSTDASDSRDWQTVDAAWSAALGDVPFLLVRNVESARRLIADALGLNEDGTVVLLANATPELVGLLDRYPVTQRFADPFARAAEFNGDQDSVFWAEPVYGLGTTFSDASGPVVLDCHDQLPDLTALRESLRGATVALFGLQLDDDPAEAGVLLCFADSDPRWVDFGQQIRATVGPESRPHPSLVIERLQSLIGPDGIAGRQRSVVEQVDTGFTQAAGLPVANQSGPGIPNGVWFRIPDLIDPATFAAYAEAEQTPFLWLPKHRPPHYRALRDGHSEVTAELSRWALIPCGPSFTDEEISHAVLGPLKAAEYLGVRWWTFPELAAAYSNILINMYGPAHDAYRPAFPVPRVDTTLLDPSASEPLACVLDPSFHRRVG